MKLNLSFFDDEEIENIASCVDKIEELTLVIDDDGIKCITICGWVILSSAISNRPTPVRKYTKKNIVIEYFSVFW